MAGSGTYDNKGDYFRKNSATTDNRSEQNNFQDSMYSDKETLDLVDEFKKELKGTINGKTSSTEKDIETATYNARLKLERNRFDPNKWEKDSSIDSDKYSEKAFLLSMPYAKTVKEIHLIYPEKWEQCNETSDKSTNKEPMDNSLENIIQPLKTLRKKLREPNSQNFLDVIQSISDDQINRADRIFYSEACNLIGNLTNYTVENAHDQVQAIRLIHGQFYNEDELRQFIKKCRTFDDAYSYLRLLSKKRTAKQSKSASASDAAQPLNRTPYHKTVVNSNPDDNDGRDANSSASDSPNRLINSSSSSPTRGRSSFENNKPPSGGLYQYDSSTSSLKSSRH